MWGSDDHSVRSEIAEFVMPSNLCGPVITRSGGRWVVFAINTKSRIASRCYQFARRRELQCLRLTPGET